MMKHADELVRTSNPVIRSLTRYPGLMRSQEITLKQMILAYCSTWHNRAEDISIMRQC